MNRPVMKLTIPHILWPLMLICTLLLGSNSHGITGPDLLMGLDKFAHVLVYGLLATALLRCTQIDSDRPVEARNILIASSLTIAVGVIDEYFQSLNPARTYELKDLAADATGAVVAPLVYKISSTYRSILELSPFKATRHPQNGNKGSYNN